MGDLERPGRLDECIDYVRQLHPDDAELARLSEARAVAEHLTQLADRLVGHFVEEARQAGASWTQIGESLGVTKQAAQKRFVRTALSMPPRPSVQPPDWIGDQTIALVERAQDEAIGLGHEYIDVEHLVLAALHDRHSLAYEMIQGLGFSPQAVRAAIIASVPGGRRGRRRPSEHLMFTPRAKEALDARRVAKRLGQRQVGPEHILLNVLGGRKGGPALKTLKELGLSDRTAGEWLARQHRTR